MRAVLSWLNRYKSVFLLTLAALMLLLAQSAYWLNHTIFDKQAFMEVTASVLDTEESRGAVASVIVDRALEDRPVLRRTISTQATQLITGLLSTDLARQSVGTVIDRTYDYLTSSDQRPIAIDLTAIKTPLSGLISFAEGRGRDVAFDPNSIPDSVELFNPQGLPDIHGYSVKLLWLGPLCWLAAAGLFAAYIYRGRRVYAKRVYIVGAVIIAACALGLLTGPLLPPPLVAQVPVTGLRGVVDGLIRGFLSPFTHQMLWTIGLTSLALIIFNQRFNLVGLVQRLVPKTTDAAKGKKERAKR